MGGFTLPLYCFTFSNLKSYYFYNQTVFKCSIILNRWHNSPFQAQNYFYYQVQIKFFKTFQCGHTTTALLTISFLYVLNSQIKLHIPKTGLGGWKNGVKPDCILKQVHLAVRSKSIFNIKTLINVKTTTKTKTKKNSLLPPDTFPHAELLQRAPVLSSPFLP